MYVFIYLPRLRNDTVSLLHYIIPYKTALSLSEAISTGQANISLVEASFPFDKLIRYASIEKNRSYSQLLYS